MKLGIILSVFAILFSGQASAQKPNLKDSKFAAGSYDGLRARIPVFMEKSDVPGMTIAAIRGGKVVWNESFGKKKSDSNEAVTNETIFEAASLTKPITAYAVFKLVDQGKIDLDVPLNKYLGSNYDVGDDKRLNLITARRVLSHTSGFPNWRNRGSKVLPINFSPGDRFSYSGEGYVYLSKVVEKITGKEFGAFVKETVLVPLGMTNSSIDWEKEFLKTKVFNHDSLGKPRGQNEARGVNAASSLHTTAGDYAKFVIAVLKGTGLKEQSHRLMLEPDVRVSKDDNPDVAWGLGWGLETTDSGKSFWHWGDNGFNKSFVIANVKSQDGVVFFTNGSNGLSFLSEILAETLHGDRPSAAWIDYQRYDSPPRILFKNSVEKDAKTALAEYLKNRKMNPGLKITERQMNRLGYDLMRLKKVTDAIAVFEQNTIDFPKSANAWDSFAEGHMVNGDKNLALKYYKKSLELDSGNKNAEEKIIELSKKTEIQ